MTEARPTLAIYAALSKKKTKQDANDRRDEESTDDQIAKVHRRLDEVYGPGGYDLLGVFPETGHSGSKKNRGPELERAIATVTRAAEGLERVELWANTAARFARGTGKRNEARAVGELFYDLRRQGVALRTVEDDEFVTNEMLVGFASAQASKYAKDLSESVRRAKRRQAERGEHLGGPMPLGYRLAEKKRVIADPDTARIIGRMVELAVDGRHDAAIARTLNAEGHRTSKGRPFNRRAVQAILLNPFYAGLVIYEDEEFEGAHEPLVDRAVWRQIVKARDLRDLGSGAHKVGRPAQNHALARLAVCGQCGERLRAVTSNYRRKDGSRARSYVCNARRTATGLCDARPFRALAIDASVVDGLPRLVADIDSWRQRIEGAHAAERHRLIDEVERAQRDHDAQAHQTSRVEARWTEYVGRGEDEKADLVLPIVASERDALTGAERRLQAARDALASVPNEAPVNAMLDFSNALRDALAGRIDPTASLARINETLREFFVAFVIHTQVEADFCAVVRRMREERTFTDVNDVEALPADLKRSVYVIQPILRLEVAQHLIAGCSDPVLLTADADATSVPPLRWLRVDESEGNLLNSHP